MARLDDATRLLAIGLLNLADDEGFFYADDKLIRSALRPFDDDSSIVRRCLAQLQKVGYIDMREPVSNDASHGPVGYVLAFEKHQRVDRPKPSQIKELYHSTNDRRMIDDESTLERKGREGKGKEGKDSSSNPAGFDDFWSAYPRKIGKGEALKAWKKHCPPLDRVLATLEWQRSSREWTRDGGQYIPHPATWLNRAGWEDQQTVVHRADAELAF